MADWVATAGKEAVEILRDYYLHHLAQRHPQPDCELAGARTLRPDSPFTLYRRDDFPRRRWSRLQRPQFIIRK